MVLVKEPQDLAGEGEISERGRGGGLRQSAGRSVIVLDEARIIRIVGGIGRPVAEAGLRRGPEEIDAVVEDCRPQAGVLGCIREIALEASGRDAAEPAPDRASGRQLESQDGMRDHAPGGAELASPAADLALPPGMEARIGVGAIAGPLVQRPAFSHLAQVVVPRLGHGPARFLLGEAQVHVVGAEEGQRLARIERHLIGLRDEVRRFGVFLELVAKPASRDQCELVLAQFNRWLAH